jgi:hypothetical protein
MVVFVGGQWSSWKGCRLLSSLTTLVTQCMHTLTNKAEEKELDGKEKKEEGAGRTSIADATASAKAAQEAAALAQATLAKQQSGK